MLETSSEVERERVYVECMSRWKSEDEVSSRQMRKMLRRKMTRLSLAHLNQARTPPLRLPTSTTPLDNNSVQHLSFTPASILSQPLLLSVL